MPSRKQDTTAGNFSGPDPVNPKKDAGLPSMQTSLNPGVQESDMPNVEEMTINEMKTIYGDSGTQRWSGFFYEEPNALMRDQKRVDTMEEMRRTDGTVKAALNAIKTPILATDWRIEGEDPEVVEFVEEQLFHMKRSWKDFLREALGFFDFGHYAFEIIWDINKDNRIVVSDLAPRIPRSIFRWKLANGNPGITQIIRTDDFKHATAEIPMQKLLVLTNDKEGDDITGQSILRAAYKHYRFKDTLYRIQGIAAERHGVGIPVIKMPTGFGEADKAKANEFARNVRSNEQGFLVLPSKEWEVDILTPSGNTQGDAIKEAISHHNSMILMTIMATFLGLGQDGTGSYALAKDLSSFFLKHVEDKCNYLAEQITDQVIKRIVRMNFGEDVEVPNLRFSPLGDIDFKELSEVLVALSAAGLIKSDGHMMQFIHKTFKLPEMSDDDVEEEDNKEEVTPPPINPLDPLNPVDPNKPIIDPNEKNKSPFPPKPLDKEAEEKMKEKKNCLHVQSLGEILYKPFRKLTVQEERSNFEKLNEKFNTLQGEIEDELEQIKKDAIRETIEQTKIKIAAGDYVTIGAVPSTILDRVRASIKRVIAEAYNFGQGMAVGEIQSTVPDATRPAMSDKGRKLRDLEAEGLTAAFIDRLEAAARSTALNAINADAADTAVITAVRDSMEDEGQRMIANISGTVVGQGINRGRLETFNHFIEKIQKFQRSEVIDGATCEMCESLDGRVVAVDDPVANMDLVHTDCRGVWVPVMVDDEQPPLDPVPKSILDNFEKVDGRPVINAFKNLKKPNLSKDNRKK